MAYGDFKTTLLATALNTLRKRMTFARTMFMDLSGAANAAARGDSVNIATVNRPSITDAQMSNTRAATSVADTDRVTLSLDQWKKSYFDVSDKDAHNAPMSMFIQLVRTHAETMADYIENFLFRTISEDDDAGKYFSGTPDTALTSSTVVGKIVEARQAISKRDGLSRDLAAFVSPDVAALLLQTSGFVQADQRGAAGEATSLSGELGRKFGIRFMESNNIWTINNSGSAAVNGAHTSGDNTVAMDGATAGQLETGAQITIGGNDHIITKGVSGTSGTVTISPALAANAANNAAVTINQSDNNWIVSPMALAFAMRPSTPHQAHGGDGNIGSLVDTSSGLSLTLEVSRIEFGTRYQFSALFGAKVVRPAQIQRLIHKP